MRRKRIILLALSVVLTFGMSVKVSSQVYATHDIYEYAPGNEAAWDAKFKDKVIKVRGTVHSIEESTWKFGYDVRLDGKGLGDRVRLYFSSDKADQLENIRKGDVITVSGRCTGRNDSKIRGSKIKITDCTLLEVRPR